MVAVSLPGSESVRCVRPSRADAQPISIKPRRCGALSSPELGRSRDERRLAVLRAGRRPHGTGPAKVRARKQHAQTDAGAREDPR